MIGIVKLAGLSAVLSAGLVTGYDELRSVPSPVPSVKPFQERLGEALAPVHAATVRGPLLNMAAKSDRLDAGCREATTCEVAGPIASSRSAVRTAGIERTSGITIASKGRPHSAQ